MMEYYIAHLAAEQAAKDLLIAHIKSQDGHLHSPGYYLASAVEQLTRCGRLIGSAVTPVPTAQQAHDAMLAARRAEDRPDLSATGGGRL